jgi:hypothetical protein
VWILPPAAISLSLPDGLLLLPHHYSAEDRELLLEILRCAAPDAPQLVVEADALDGLLARHVRWPESVVLLHGFDETVDVEALGVRARALGAKHTLLQLPRAQLTGTSWLERVLKVPLLRALERAWKSPDHPLRSLGIADLPLREAARYTDDPVEFLILVRRTLEHRLRSVGVGVGPSDWVRSLDHALAARLRTRAGGELPIEALSRTGTPAHQVTDADFGKTRVGAGGLLFSTASGLRAAPIMSALERPIVRAYASAGPTASHGASSAHARALFHIASEAAALELESSTRVFAHVSKATLRVLGVNAGDVMSLLAWHRSPLLELDDVDRALSARVLLTLRNLPASTSKTARETASAMAKYIVGMWSSGPRALDEITASLHAFESVRLRAKWWEPALVALRESALVHTWVSRSNAEALSRAMRPLLGGLPVTLEVRRVITALDRQVEPRSLEPFEAARVLHAIATGSPAIPGPRYHPDDAPESPWQGAFELWELLATDEASWIVRHASSFGVRGPRGGSLTAADLHKDLVIGIAALSLGDLDLATERGHLVLDFATRYEIPVHRAFARELLAAVHELRGDYDEAAKLLFQSRSRYLALRDNARIVGVEQRLARMKISFTSVAHRSE